jgi:vacuolar-type H+-ATPase subunit E/Vma4
MIKADELHGNEVLKVSQNDQARYLRLFTTGRLTDNYYLLDKLCGFLGKPSYQLKLSKETIKIDGGFVIVGDSYDIDHSYQTMFENLKEQYESEIAQMLFGGE